jgi:hypothetical protein
LQKVDSFLLEFSRLKGEVGSLRVQLRLEREARAQAEQKVALLEARAGCHARNDIQMKERTLKQLT